MFWGVYYWWANLWRFSPDVSVTGTGDPFLMMVATMCALVGLIMILISPFQEKPNGLGP
jgi:hypothetical protein